MTQRADYGIDASADFLNSSDACKLAVRHPDVSRRCTQSGETGVKDRNFIAIDFETADPQRDSACAVALVRVDNGKIVARQCHLIRPPRRQFVFTHLHGITYSDVIRQPTFGQLWPRLSPLLRGIDFFAAHNAPFDRSVLRACCKNAGLAMPKIPFLCTVRLARQTWKLTQATLPDVCRHLKLVLTHHHAASDAEACARIVMAAASEPQARRFDYHESHAALLSG